MKKIFLTLSFVLLISSMSYGAATEDMNMYVRKDVFDAKMEAIDSKLDKILEELQAQRKEITALTQSVAVLSERVDGNYKTLDTKMTEGYKILDTRISGMDLRINALNTRIDDLRNGLYLGLVLFAALILLPFFNKWWENREEKRKAANLPFTLEDVKRLIAEAQLSGKPQI